MNQDKGERFKIDIDKSYGEYVALFERKTKRRLWFTKQVWIKIDRGPSIDDLKRTYEKIKDLPEYLP